jgi:hypothetical protein
MPLISPKLAKDCPDFTLLVQNHHLGKLKAIAQQLFDFAAGRILKGIANNFSELINEVKHS